jgi:hypothetical protein
LPSALSPFTLPLRARRDQIFFTILKYFQHNLSQAIAEGIAKESGYPNPFQKEEKRQIRESDRQTQQAIKQLCNIIESRSDSHHFSL